MVRWWLSLLKRKRKSPQRGSALFHVSLYSQPWSASMACLELLSREFVNLGGFSIVPRFRQIVTCLVNGRRDNFEHAPTLSFSLTATLPGVGREINPSPVWIKTLLSPTKPLFVLSHHPPFCVEENSIPHSQQHLFMRSRKTRKHGVRSSDEEVGGKEVRSSLV